MKTNVTKRNLSRFLLCGILIAFGYVNLISADDTDSSNVVEVYAFNTLPIIDGIIDAGWDNNEYLKIEKIIEEYSMKTEFEEGDFDAKFKVSWYGNKLYFLVVVTDEDLFKDGYNVWDNDHFMLILDLGNEKTYSENILLDSNDHNIVIPWGQPEKIYAFSGDEHVNSAFYSLYEYGENINIETNKFVAEFAIDVRDFNMPEDLSEDTEFGFDILVRDYDLNLYDSIYFPDQEIWAQWNAETTEGWYNRAELGSVGLCNIRLKSANAPTAIQNNKYNSSITLYPVPTSDILNIQSDVAINYVEIYNILGNLVLSAELNNQFIDVSSLVKGLYTVTMYDKTGNVSSQKIMVE